MSTYSAPLRLTVSLAHPHARVTGLRRYFACKRLIDVCISALALVVTLPALVVLSAAISLDSPGPPIFKQKRMGARPRFNSGGLVWEVREFPFYKFRSMHCDANEEPHREYIRHCIQDNTATSQFKLSHDARVTRMGRFLRRTSLDELPQLINVLKGEMSLVGPRPVPAYEVELYQDSHCKRLAAIPGITGLWQVTARGQRGFEEMVRLDVAYVERASLSLDFEILLRTIPAVLSQRGAK
jgi:lipopolysaccharide/colanic/teichoic acid biosynthesis glycosyltransferase